MRSAEFDKEQVLRSAINLFAEKGFSQTSMQDIKRATGLHPGSIYCAFDNKQGLLLAALEQYSTDRAAEYRALFSDTDSVKSALQHYLENTLKELTIPGHQSVCLSQKALSEMALVNPEVSRVVSHNLTQWQLGFVEAFDRALAQGELSGTRTAQQRARFWVMGIYGLRTFAQSENDPQVLNDLAQQLLEDVCR